MVSLGALYKLLQVCITCNHVQVIHIYAYQEILIPMIILLYIYIYIYIYTYIYLSLVVVPPEFNTRNILNVAGFPSTHWRGLGMELGLQSHVLTSIE